MADAYKVLKAVTIPRALTRLEDDAEGNPRYSTEGRLYSEGEYVRAADITPPLRERADNGELDEFLEAVSSDELEAAERSIARAGQFSTFAPEHEVERVTLNDYGHDVLSRKQILEMNSAGAEAASEALEAAKEDGADERPNITEQPSFAEVEDLATASREGRTVGAQDDPEYAAEVDPERDSLQTMPSGVVGGATKLAAEGGEVPSDEDEKPKRKPRARKRPGNAEDSTASGGEKQE